MLGEILPDQNPLVSKTSCDENLIKPRISKIMEGMVFFVTGKDFAGTVHYLRRGGYFYI